MSLLQNQDFIIYRIRSRYLQCIRDGVGERLITVNPAPLNVPAFKNAGWAAAQDIKRTYSPPIPSGTTGEYFANRGAARSVAEESTSYSVARKVEDGGLLGSRFSGESQEEGDGAKTPRADPSSITRPMPDRDDDSSDMSDDSDDDEQSLERPHKLQFDFSKKELPHRPRAGSSPIRNPPQVLLTSSSVSKSRTRRIRGGSHGDVDYKVSEHSGSVPGADEHLLSSGFMTEQEKLHADIANRLRSSPSSSVPRNTGYDSGDDSDASSSLSSDFAATADSNPDVIGNSLSPPSKMSTRPLPGVLSALPPPIRPVSQVQPVSALTLLLKAKDKEDESPLEGYRFLSGKGELAPVYLKIYMPLCKGDQPIEVVLNRMAKTEDGSQGRETTVAEAIGYTLYKYVQDELQPLLDSDRMDINRWTFRMVDDGEPDEDFPPLERTKPITSYMTNKPTRGGRLGAANREVRMEEEFALVEATEEQYEENCRVTPSKVPPKRTAHIAAQPTLGPPSGSGLEVSNSPVPTLGPSSRQVAADVAAAVSAAGTTSTPRTGPSKILRIRVASIDNFTQSISVCVTTDTYIGEVLEQVCRKKNLDKSKFILRVTGAPNVVAPLDRTVASLGDRSELDLVRRRFLGASEGLGDRPGSPSTVDSPNAPLIISETPIGRTPKKGKFLHPALWTPDMLSSKDYLKFTVWRKTSMSMSFMSRHERILAIDGEYVHIMPSDQKTLLFVESQAKTRSIHISTIIGCKTSRKAPSNFQILVMRPQKKTKRYDFEAISEEQADEVVTALRKAIMEFRMDHTTLAG